MTAPWHKALRDFWYERTRSILVVLAIAIGIAAFASVLASYAILTRDLNRGYLATNPASATLYVDAIDDDLVAAVLANRAVSDAEPRRSVRGRFKVGPAEWRQLVLFAVKDYGDIRVSRLEPQQGAWPPATGEILLERDALQVAKTRIGDVVTIRTNGGKERTLRLTGTVKDVGQAQARMENLVYGYITQATLAQLGEEPYLDQLQILVAGKRFDQEHVRRVASDVRTLLEQRGHTVRRMDVPEPGKHPHADLMGMLLLAMSSFGLFILVLSGILVVNLMTALMAAQVRQIGTMKAVGGTHGQIARIYYSQALLYGLAAIVLAFPLSALGTRALCRSQAKFLNFDVYSFSVPLWVYLSGAAVGIIVPVVAAALPVWKGTSISILDALGVRWQNHRAGSKAAALPPHSYTSMVLRNVLRHKVRLALTLVTLAAGGLFFMSALNVRSSMIGTIDALFATRRYDLTIGLGEMTPIDAVERAVRETPGIRDMEGWISADGPIVAIPVDTKMLAPVIVEGRKLRPGDTNAVVVNGSLASRLGAKVGDTVGLRFGDRTIAWRVVGIAREPFTSGVGYVPRSYAEVLREAPNQTNSVRLVLEKTDRDSINRVKADLDRNFERAGIRAVASLGQADTRYSFDQHMLMIYVFLIVIAAVIAAVGGLGLTTTVSLNVLERRREMGVMRAIGATPMVVCLIFVAEAVIVGIASWGIAALAAGPISRSLGNALTTAMFKSRLDFVFDPRGLALWLAVSVVVSALAGLFPSWRASRAPIREAIEYE